MNELSPGYRFRSGLSHFLLIQFALIVAGGLAFDLPICEAKDGPSAKALPSSTNADANKNLPQSRETNPVFLDDLTEQKFEVGFGKLGKHGSTGYPAPFVQRLRLRGTEVKHGLSVVPKDKGIGFVEHALDRPYQVFRASAAINSPTAADGLRAAERDKWNGKAAFPMTFRVIGNDKLLWESKPLQKHGDAEDCEVAIEGVEKLRLEVKCDGLPLFAWSFWADARVASREASPAPAAPAAEDPNVVAFQPVMLDEPATAITMTEDGRYVAVSHQADNLVSIWDVRAAKLLKKLETPSPRTMLCRGTSLFVVNYGVGSVSEFSRDKDWSLVNKLEVDKPNIVHISAPHAVYFKDELLLTFHGNGPQGSYQGNGNYIVNTKTGKLRNSSNGKVASFGYVTATFNYDGKLVIAQGSFQLSPRGGVTAYPYADLLTGTAQSVFSGHVEERVCVNQSHSGSFWYGGGTVLAGAPRLARIPLPAGSLVIPDLSQRVLYRLTKDRLVAHKLNSSLTEIDSRKISWPAEGGDVFGGISNLDRQGGYLIDEPAAFTHDGQLNVFAMHAPANQVYTARTKALVIPDPAEARLASSSSKEATPRIASPSAPVTKPTQPDPAPQDSGVIAPNTLELPEVATAMALTEDGLFLIVSHQTGNMISIWDVMNNKLVKTCETSSPRTVLCRGDKIFVANYGEGTISMFSRQKNWELVNQFDTDQKNIVHISAPHREHFKDELLASCHGDGVEGSYRGNTIVYVDTKQDKHRVVPPSRGGGMGSAIATFSYEGKLVAGQGSFNLSPGGAVFGFPTADFLKGNANSVFGWAVNSNHYLNQEHPGSFWYGASSIISGAPRIVKTSEELGKLIVPDLSQRVLYGVYSDRLQAYRLDNKLTEIASRKIEWPEGDKSLFEGICRAGGRHRAYLLDGPAAYTHGGQLYLFMMDDMQNRVIMARTPALVPGGAGGVELAAVSAANTPSREKPASATTVDEFGLPGQISEGTKLNVTLQGPAGAEYELLTGPDGMELSKSGQITWTATSQQLGAHALKIRIKVGSKISFMRPKLEVVDKELIAGNGGSAQSVEQGERLLLDLDHLEFTPAQGYSSLLLLQGDRLRVLGGNGLKVIHERKLPNRYRQIATRGDDYIALMNEPHQLDLIDSKTLKVRQSIALERAGVRVMKTMDMVPHPFRGLTYVSIEHDIHLPRYRLLIVDEKTGNVEAPDDMIGTWLKVDPGGRFLYAGYEDLYRRGSEFHINPGFRVIETPKYGNIDWLITYDLRRSKPKMMELLQNAGGNGNGIVLSADGKRITYLSHVGTPLHSGNLVGWNPTKLKEEAVTYAAKGKGSPTMLAFHPMLPIVAIPGSGSAVLFHRETGTELKDKLQLTSQGLGDAKVDQALFSPDGASLIFVCNDASGRYLRRVGLRLTKDELAIAARGVPQISETPFQIIEPKKNLLQINESEIDGLNVAERSETLSTKEIGRRYLDSVVVIKSEESVGTGFVIGKQGIILTCAHCIPEDGEVSVTYNFLDKDQSKTRTLKGKVVRIEPERDLALLKIESPALVPVALGLDNAVESGEEVTVIGNPGLGKEILAHTITTGIVSNPKRVFEDQEYIQTSAVVNPGNSGGPLFDSQGRVIGLVVSKATTNEGTAFAVPARVLRKFLKDATVSNR